jgi:hypothetical protein
MNIKKEVNMESLFSAEETNRLNKQTSKEDLQDFFKESLTGENMSVEEAKKTAQKWAEEMSKNNDE